MIQFATKNQPRRILQKLAACNFRAQDWKLIKLARLFRQQLSRLFVAAAVGELRRAGKKALERCFLFTSSLIIIFCTYIQSESARPLYQRERVLLCAAVNSLTTTLICSTLLIQAHCSSERLHFGLNTVAAVKERERKAQKRMVQ
jgi:hypothetical protein